jgi:serine/threonine-protein kinase
MGIVYRGTHQALGKRVAIKRLDHRLATEPQAYERFRREAIAACRVDSPFVVQVFDWGKAPDDSPFIVMELLEGKSLRAHLELEGRLLPDAAVQIAVQILKGLHRIHQAEILHRDLKPENVFLCEYDQATPFVKLVDFGISKQLGPAADTESVTRTGTVIGTATYMSPEQALGETPLDARSDLYSAGAVLYEMLTGTAPHIGRSYEATLVDLCTRDADDVRLSCPLVPEPLALVVKCALARNREQRFASAADFLEALLKSMPSLRVERTSNATLHPEFFANTELSKLATLRNLPAAPQDRNHAARQRGRIPGVLGLTGIAAILLLLALAGRWIWRNESSPARFASSANSTSTLSQATSTTANAIERELPSPTMSTTAPIQPLTQEQVAHQRTTSPAAATPIASSRPSLSHRHDGSTSGSTQPSKPSVGVAGGLKLRRTMP